MNSYVCTVRTNNTKHMFMMSTLLWHFLVGGSAVSSTGTTQFVHRPHDSDDDAAQENEDSPYRSMVENLLIHAQHPRASTPTARGLDRYRHIIVGSDVQHGVPELSEVDAPQTGDWILSGHRSQVIR